MANPRKTLAALIWVLFPTIPAASLPSKPVPPIERLKEAAKAHHQHRFSDCAKLLAGLDGADILNPDASLFLEGQCLFYSGDRLRARTRFARLVKDHQGSPHAALATFRVADCDWELGARRLAVSEYQHAATQQADPSVDRAVGLFHRTEFMLDAKREREGRQLWIELLSRHPDHPLAASLPGNHPPFRLGVGDALSVAGTLHKMRRWDEALAVLDSSPNPTNDRDRSSLAFRTGRILFDMPGRKEEAARLFFGARDHAPAPVAAEEAWFWGSRSMTRAGRVQESITSHLTMIDRYPTGANAPQALFYAGFLEQHEGHFDHGLRLFQRIWDRFGKNRLATDARWFAAWCHIQQAQWSDAITALGPQLSVPSSSVGGRALYWTGVAYQELQKPNEARTFWDKTVAQNPLGWYALLARVRLGEGAATLPAPSAAGPRPVLIDGVLDRATELVAADLRPFATILLSYEEKSFLKNHPGTDGLLALLDAYRGAGDYHRSWFLALTRAGAALNGLPSPATRAFWDHAYPPCAREQLVRNAGSDLELALFLQAIMRSESGFDPIALSIADARGLMQMTTPTAARVAADLGITVAPENLFDPELNIRLAAHHLAHLAAKFHRQWPIAAAAYNAGAGAVMKWYQENSHLPLDRFVETIPFAETREYVKTVTEALARYAYLEGSPLPQLKLALDPKYEEDGIDY